MIRQRTTCQENYNYGRMSYMEVAIVDKDTIKIKEKM